MLTIRTHADLVTAIRELVAYNWSDEERDFVQQERMGEETKGHIFNTLTALDKWATED